MLSMECVNARLDPVTSLAPVDPQQVGVPALTGDGRVNEAIRGFR